MGEPVPPGQLGKGGVAAVGEAKAVPTGVAASGSTTPQVGTEVRDQVIDTPTPLDPCADPLLAHQDEDFFNCILELCATDPDIVEAADRDLTLYTRNPKVIELQTFNGSSWETTRRATSLGSARGSTIWVNRGQACSVTKNTIYHEVHHTRQPDSMSSRYKEIDAYLQTEQWLISRGIPGNGRFRTTVGSTEIPNRTAIEAHVDQSYGYSDTTQRIVGRVDEGATVILEDGTQRPAQRGDNYQYIPPQELCERRAPPGRLQCP